MTAYRHPSEVPIAEHVPPDRLGRCPVCGWPTPFDGGERFFGLYTPGERCPGCRFQEDAVANTSRFQLWIIPMRPDWEEFTRDRDDVSQNVPRTNPLCADVLQHLPMKAYPLHPSEPIVCPDPSKHAPK